MTSIADGSVIFQTSAESAPSTLSWFGEVTLIAAYLPQHGVLTKISERVCFARRRFGHYDVIDFLVVLFGYAISGERALLRLDGLYGTGAVVADLADLSFVMRGKDYTVLDQPVVQARLHLPADSHFSRPESTLVRAHSRAYPGNIFAPPRRFPSRCFFHLSRDQCPVLNGFRSSDRD